MDMTVIGLILIGVVGMFYVVFTWGSTKKTGGTTTKKTTTAKPTTKPHESSTSNIEKKKEEVQRKDMFKFIEFDRIVDDMILQEKESKYTMVIQCKGINYDLMSEIEQIAVEEGFITFLNTLKSPIQIYVQARAINLKTSLDMYKSRVDDINQKFAESTESLKKLSDNINTSDNEIREASIQRERYANIAEYAQDITRYVEKLSLNKHMLQRKFYIVISYYKSEVNATAEFSKTELHDICYRELYTRAQSIIGALQACSVSSKVLTSNELAELLYISYNRDDEKLLDVKTALDSGFYRMYSTTKDVQEKKREILEKEIQEEAMNRVEQAIKLAIANGIIKTEDQMVEEFENSTDIEAIKILEETDIAEGEKKKIQQVIVDQHNRNLEERQKQRELKQNSKKVEEAPESVQNTEDVKIDLPKEEIKKETSSINKPEEIKFDLQKEEISKVTSSTNKPEDSIV